MTATGTAIDHHHTGIATITIPMCGAKATALAIKQMAIEMAGARSGMTSGMAGARGQITAVRSSAEVLTTTGSMPTGVPLTVIVVLRPRPMDRLRTEEP